MRILHIITAFNKAGGAERYLFLLARGLKAKGHHVYVICSGGDNLQALDQNDIPYSVLPLAPEQRSLKNIWINFWNIRKIVKKDNFQIVHCHHRWPALLAWILSWLIKIFTVNTVHVWHSSHGLKAKLSFKLDRIVAVSKTMQQQLIKDFNVPASKTRLVYCGLEVDNSYKKVDMNEFFAKHNIPSKSFKYVNIGRLAEQKGQRYLIQSFCDYISASCSDDILLIVGDGPLLPELTQVAGNLLNRQIFLLGSLPNDKALALLAAADVFVLSSLWEGLPLTLIEAGLLCKPLITTDVDGIKEVITGPELGITVPPRNSVALKNAFIRIKNDAKMRTELGNNLHRKVVGQFSESKMVSSYESVYRELIQK
jgi:glycosyltransferase involved in cell wall biosynthesis